MVGFGITSSNGQIQVKRALPICRLWTGTPILFTWMTQVSSRTFALVISGGAALKSLGGSNFELVGVNSFTYGECESWYAGVARVDRYISWIGGYVDFHLSRPVSPASLQVNRPDSLLVSPLVSLQVNRPVNQQENRRSKKTESTHCIPTTTITAV